MELTSYQEPCDQFAVSQYNNNNVNMLAEYYCERLYGDNVAHQEQEKDQDVDVYELVEMIGHEYLNKNPPSLSMSISPPNADSLVLPSHPQNHFMNFHLPAFSPCPPSLSCPYTSMPDPPVSAPTSSIDIDPISHKRTRDVADYCYEEEPNCKRQNTCTSQSNMKIINFASNSDDDGRDDNDENSDTPNNVVENADLDGYGKDSKSDKCVGDITKKRRKRGSACDPQSVYARKRRDKINQRLKTLQNLVPNGNKVDISTMLEQAIHYVKFLQLQIKLLSSDEHWMYAPIAMNGGFLNLPNENTHN